MFKKLFIISILMTLPVLANAQMIKRDCLPFTDTNGNEICNEYYEQCTDAKGKYVKCDESLVGKIFKKKTVKKCRSKETGKFIKCPAEEK